MSVELESKQMFNSSKKLKFKGLHESNSSYKSELLNNTLSMQSNLAPAQTNTTSHYTRSVLLSKLTFNISRGHYNFVCELLKNKAENKQRIKLETDANQILTNQKLWLQLETNKLNKKFLQGKTPLILCSYIKETEWAMPIARLLIENGAYLTIKNANNGCGPLHYACALLKPDLIKLFLKNLSFNLQSTRDFNGNSPLVYFLVSFYFYHKRINLLNNMSKSKKTSENFSSIDESSTSCIMEVNFQKRIDQNNRFHQLKCIETLRDYLDHLKRLNLGINTSNRNGVTVQDFYNNIVNAYPSIEKHEFFKAIKNALANEVVNGSSGNLKESLFLKLPSINNDQLTKVLNMGNLNSNSIINANTYNNNHEINSFLYDSSYVFAKSDLCKFLKANLHIDLSDIENQKVISHSKKNDENLSYLYLNKRVRDRITSGASIPDEASRINHPHQQQTVPLVLKQIDYESLITTTSLHSTISNNSNSIAKLQKGSIKLENSSWRDRFCQFYNFLEANNSDSYRKSTKLSFTQEESTNLPQINAGKGIRRSQMKK